MSCRVLLSLVSIWSSGSSGSSQSSQKMIRRLGRPRRLLVSIRSSQSLERLKTCGHKLCSWVRQQSFGMIFANKMANVNRKTNLLACYLLILLILHRRRARRIPWRHRFWVRQIYQKWEELGTYHTLEQELRLHDREFFFRYDFQSMRFVQVYKETDWCRLWTYYLR